MTPTTSYIWTDAAAEVLQDLETAVETETGDTLTMAKSEAELVLWLLRACREEEAVIKALPLAAAALLLRSRGANRAPHGPPGE